MKPLIKKIKDWFLEGQNLKDQFLQIIEEDTPKEVKEVLDKNVKDF